MNSTLTVIVCRLVIGRTVFVGRIPFVPRHVPRSINYSSASDDNRLGLSQMDRSITRSDVHEAEQVSRQ